MDLSLDYVFSKSTTATNPKSGGLPFASLSDLNTWLHSVNLLANYKLNENLSLKFRYRFEYFKIKDFALDNVAPNTLANVISLGDGSLDYKAHVVGVSAVLAF